MASITLYNKWRPQTFADPDRHPLIGQEHVTRTLRNAVARNQIAHAYLFCGPRGTGKTSAARILARAVNCRRGLQGEPCNECENCLALLTARQLDLLIEIDGASNRGVDDVRQLRERLMQRPGGSDLTGRFKVYIIDEVHMLTQEAFNALLKSLEEPPPHVVFILATTDPQKVPATVASRCQRFDFRPIPLETLVAHLTHVGAAEGVRLEAGAAEMLARSAAGGARDAISLLDQALAFAGATGAETTPGGPLAMGAPPVTLGHIQAMLGLTSFDAICRLVDSVVERDLPTGLRLVHDVAGQGVDLRQFARQVIEFLRALLLAESDAGALLRLDEESQEAVRQRARRLSLAELVRLIKLFTQAEQGLKAPSAQPQLPLELAIVEASLAAAPAVASQPQAPQMSAPPPPAPAPERAPPQPVAAAPLTPAGPTSGPTSGTPATPAPSTAPPAAGAPVPQVVVPLEARPPSVASATPEAAGVPEAPEAPEPPEARTTAASFPTPATSAPEPAPADTTADGVDSGPAAERTPAIAARLDAEPAPDGDADAGSPPAPTDADATAQTSRASRPAGSATTAISIDLVRERWSAVLEAVRQTNRSVAALLAPNDAKPITVDAPNVIVVEFRFDFHRKKILEPPNRIAVEKALRRVLGTSCRIKCVQAEGTGLPFDRPRGQTTQDDPVVAKALRIWRAHVLSPTELTAVEALPTVADLSNLQP